MLLFIREWADWEVIPDFTYLIGMMRILTSKPGTAVGLLDPSLQQSILVERAIHPLTLNPEAGQVARLGTEALKQ